MKIKLEIFSLSAAPGWVVSLNRNKAWCMYGLRHNNYTCKELRQLKCIDVVLM